VVVEEQLQDEELMDGVDDQELVEELGNRRTSSMTGSLQERYGEEGRSYTVVTGVK
jgi:hypothetical protein